MLSRIPRICTEPQNSSSCSPIGAGPTSITVAGGTCTFGIPAELDSSSQPITSYIAGLQVTSSDPIAATGGWWIRLGNNNSFVIVGSRTGDKLKLVVLRYS